MKHGILSAKKLSLLYCVYAFVAMLIVVTRLPPFMGADEPNHLRRANLLTEGELTGSRVRVGGALTSGGVEEENLNRVEALYAPMKFHPEVKLRSIDSAKGGAIPWGQDRIEQSFENTAIYPPAFYLPSAVALGIGKAQGSSITKSLTLARVANAMVCLIVGYFAVRSAKNAAKFLFAILLLPMSLVLSTSVSQDGLLIAVASLACACLARGLQKNRSITIMELSVSVVCLALVGMAKPPYVLFSFFLLVVHTEKPSLKWAAAAVSTVSALAWHGLMAANVQTPMQRPGLRLDSSTQLALLLHRPWQFGTVLYQTLRHQGSELFAQFVGELGWLDTPLPKLYYLAALLILVSATVLTYSATSKVMERRSISVLIIMGATVLAIFGALYLAYTPVGSPQVDGVQGRYFLPVAAFLPLVLVGNRKAVVGPIRRLGGWVLILFPLLTLPVLWRTLTLRYY
jgi:uncharacterized membrane protein